MEPDFPVLYDGWPLVYAPGSQAALHVLELLEALPAGFTAWLALPGDLHTITAGELPGFSPAVVMPAGAKVAAAQEQVVSIVQTAAPNTAAGRTRWEQQAMPALARQVSARVLHTTSLRPPLFSPVPVVLSPVEGLAQPAAEGFIERMRAALGQGGYARVRAVLWPEDLPAPALALPVFSLPPRTHSAFQQPQPRLADLPESYLFAPDPPDAAALELLAAAWSWVSAGLGEDWVLLVSGLEDGELERLRILSREAGASGAVAQVQRFTPAARASVFQHAAAVLACAPPRPWADAYLHALACARPLAAEETLLADARTGPAGYLVPPGDARALGAAALTLLVEETMAVQLAQAAELRVNGWQQETFPARLGAVYRSL